MAVFTDAEVAYLATQRLGRLATVSKDGSPHVVPVTFSYNPEHETIDIGGRNFAKRKKYRDAQRDGRVAFVVDDVLPPWSPRMLEIRGRADVLATGGKAINADFDDEMFRIHPTRIVSYGIGESAAAMTSRAI
jgi:pyridoxamine 5'-phosphate oxidase family protein